MSEPETAEYEGIEREAGEVTCTLSQDEATERGAWVRAEVLDHLEAVREREDGYVFEYARSAEAFENVVEFVRLESVCCADFRYEVVVPAGGDSIRVAVTGPDGTQELIRRGFLDRFEAVPEPT